MSPLSPFFVKDGGLIPLVPEHQWAATRDESVPLEDRHHDETPGELFLHDDDGETFDYQHGQSSWTNPRVTKIATGTWQGGVTPQKNAAPWHYSGVTWRFMSAPTTP